MKLRKINRVLHRDLGYFFTGMVLIYSISGIALNHLRQWNSNYIITKIEFEAKLPTDSLSISTESIQQAIAQVYSGPVLSHYYPKPQTLKAFVDNGSITFDLSAGRALLERLQRRPFFNQINFLHYNYPRKWWTLFSDVFAFGLIIIAITGLFIIRGKNGISRRGAVFVTAGFILPVLALILFFG